MAPIPSRTSNLDLLGSGFGVQGFGFRVLGSGFGVRGFTVQGPVKRNDNGRRQSDKRVLAVTGRWCELVTGA